MPLTTNSVSTAPPAPNEVERDVRRIKATVLTIILVAAGLAIIEAALAVATGAKQLGFLAIFTGVFSLILVPVAVWLTHGRLARSVLIASIAIMGIQSAYLIAYPRAYPAVAIASIVIVALALSFIRGRALLAVTFAAWAIAVTAVLYGVLAPRGLDVPASADAPLLIGTGVAAVTVAMVLLWQFAKHMNAALEELHASNASLLEAHDKLQELDRLKSQIINSAAHELNTPLTPVMIQLSILKESPHPEQAHALEILERNLNRINSLVREMLDGARLQAGRLELPRTTFDAAALAAKCVHEFRDQARPQGVQLVMTESAHVTVQGDPRRVAQAVNTLLSNAVDLTPSGGMVTIAVKHAGDHVEIAITDTGIGLTEAQIADIFEPFSRVHPENVVAQGTGLGLHISRGMVEEMGGHIWVTSPGPGRGATVAFSLPLAGLREAPPS